MGYDEGLAKRVRRILSRRKDVVEKRMVGGLSFLVGGSMCCGVTSTGLMIRVGSEAIQRTLAQPHVRPMKLGGRRLAAFVLVDPAGCRTDGALERWVQRSVDFVKAAKGPTKRTSNRVTDELDARAVGVIEAFRADPGLAAVIHDFEARKTSAARKFGSNGLKVNGKLFVLFTQGTLVTKLPRERVAALIASRVGKPFDPGHGRLMKEWLKITNGNASWIDLAKEAYRFVSGASR